MKKLLNGINCRSMTTEEKIYEHEIKAIVLGNNPVWSSWCSCMAQDSEQWKRILCKGRDSLIFPRAVCFSYFKDDRPKVIASFLLDPCVPLVISMVVKLREPTQHINNLIIVLQDIQSQILFPWPIGSELLRERECILVVFPY